MADLNLVRENLEKRGYSAKAFATGAEAAEYLSSVIQDTVVVFGGTQTAEDLGLYEKLGQNNTVIKNAERRARLQDKEFQKEVMSSPVFIASANGVSEDGDIVNIDGFGNRTSGILHGHERVFLVIGRNKIVPTLEDAVFRARNVAAPRNAQKKQLNTPCAINGDRCYDCNSPQRICRGMEILLRPVRSCKTEIVLVDEDLGM
ncbi:MAG: lactate utilization protein [Butyrivibrio sp.]|nr:lactate utilization protein [Butyrivibrio sp.]